MTIPAPRLSFPDKIVRVSFGQRMQVTKDGRSVWTTERLDHLFLARLAKRKTIGGRRERGPQTDAGEPQYRRDERLMTLLREEHRKAGCEEACCASFEGETVDWQPLWVPVYVIGPPEWWWHEGIQADLGPRWVCRCSGPWATKSDEQIEEDGEHLERRGLPVSVARLLSDQRRTGNVLLVTSTAQRRKVSKEQRGGYEVKLVGTPEAVECNPARCPMWWKRGRKAGEIACEEIGTFTFLLPFLAGAEQWGFWRTRGKASIDRMRSTIAAAMTQAGGDLTFVPLRLGLTVEPVLTPNGDAQNQPIANLSLHMPAEQMAQLIEWRGQQRIEALTGYVGDDGLPRLNPHNVPQAHERAMLPEWHPREQEDKRPWQARAWEDGLEAGVPDTQITAWVEQCESDDQFGVLLAEWRAAQGPQDRDLQEEGEPDA